MIGREGGLQGLRRGVRVRGGGLLLECLERVTAVAFLILTDPGDGAKKVLIVVGLRGGSGTGGAVAGGEMGRWGERA